MAVHRYDDLVRSQPGEFAWPDLSIYLHSLSLCTANAVALSASDRGLIVRADVPRQRLGLPARQLLVRRGPDAAAPNLDPDSWCR